MGRMKEKLMDAVYDNMNLISNHYDGDAEMFITGEMETIMADLDKVFQTYHSENKSVKLNILYYILIFYILHFVQYFTLQNY